MKSAKIIFLSVIGAVILALIGCFAMSNYYKGYMPDNYPRDLPTLIEKYKDIYRPTFIMDYIYLEDTSQPQTHVSDCYYENAPLIVKCTPTRNAVQLYDCTQQKIKVQEVYRGDKKLVGKEISFTTRICFSHNSRRIAYSFVNYMNMDEEYLLFLYPYGYTEESPQGIDNGYNFIVTDDGNIPYLSFSEHENITCASLGEKNPVYSKVINNEFFVQDEKALKATLEYKKKIMDKYAH